MLVDKSGMMHAAIREKQTDTHAVFVNHLEKSTHKRELSKEGVSWIETSDMDEAFRFLGIE